MSFKPTSVTQLSKVTTGFPRGELTVFSSGSINTANSPTAAKTALSKFNDNELQKIRTLKSQLVTTDAGKLFEYGTTIQTTFDKISDEVLGFAKCSDFDIVGDKLTQVIINVKQAQPGETSKLPFIGNWITKIRNSKERLQGQFASAADQVDRIVLEIDTIRDTISGRLPVLEQMFQANVQMYRDLEMHIQAGKIAIEEITNQTDAFAASLSDNPDPSLTSKW
jgi:uncharacterized protein YaaN involved in tellurite resistance